MRISASLAAGLLLATAALAAAPPEGSGAKADLLWGKLEAGVAAIDASFDGVLGVAILDLTDGRLLLRNGDEVFPTASTIKLAVLAELYEQEARGAAGESGQARLAESLVWDGRGLVDGSDILANLTPGSTRLTLRDLAACMVAVSDNTAANRLIDRLGMDRVNALLDQLGLPHTRLRRRMMDLEAARAGRENVATPRELVGLLAAVYRSQAFPSALAADFFKLLQTHKESYLPRLLPATVLVANKPGDLSGVRVDAGVVLVPHRPFAIAVMTTYSRDANAAEAAIARIGLLAWSTFDRLGGSSPYGRALPP